MDKIELYDEDEIAEGVPLESWDWDVNDQLLEGDFSQHEIGKEEKSKTWFPQRR